MFRAWFLIGICPTFPCWANGGRRFKSIIPRDARIFCASLKARECFFWIGAPLPRLLLALIYFQRMHWNYELRELWSYIVFPLIVTFLAYRVWDVWNRKVVEKSTGEVFRFSTSRLVVALFIVAAIVI